MKEQIALLVGGVGGAKVAYGLAQLLPPDSLSIIVNTGDDFVHLGLHVSPDIDTVMYTLADISNKQQGWGLEGDTLQAMGLVKRYGGPSWFNLGDKDLGTNLTRTVMMNAGRSLTEVTTHLAQALGVMHPILPMSDDAVRTELTTDKGRLIFQEYFVRERWQPKVEKIEFVGSETARATDAVQEALGRATAIVLGPSNPFLSIDPILSVREIREALLNRRVPCVAISPIVNGQALKGPAAKLMQEFGRAVSVEGIAQHYSGLIDALIVDETDGKLKQSIEEIGIHCVVRPTVMTSDGEKKALAGEIIRWLRAETSTQGALK